jgi:lipoprotein-anchoring transpeptidase ErfK/SrfK
MFEGTRLGSDAFSLQKSIDKFRCEMKQLAYALALAGASVLVTGVASTPAFALETDEAKMEANDAASQARADMFEAFGPKALKPGQYFWRDVPTSGQQRVIVSLSDQLAYVYRGETLVAVSTISSGKDEKPTPTGIFSVLDKQPMYRSKKYDNAPMPWMQRIDQYGIALHAGYNPGIPASHGCVRLPSAFAKKLYSVTDVGTPVYIGA